jgi:hypothetical protein
VLAMRRTYTLLFAVGCVAPLWAHGSVEMAQAFMLAAYSDLVQNESLGVRVLLEPISQNNPPDWERISGVSVQLEHGRPRMVRSADDQDAQLLGVSMAFDLDGLVVDVRSQGTYTHSRKLRDMRRFAAARANLSDAEMLKELKRRGAKFAGDLESFEKALSLTQLEPFIGRIVTRDIRFDTRDPTTGQRPDPESFGFEWIVTVQTEPAPLEHRCYDLRFEPFDGRLTRLQFFARC